MRVGGQAVKQWQLQAVAGSGLQAHRQVCTRVGLEHTLVKNVERFHRSWHGNIDLAIGVVDVRPFPREQMLLIVALFVAGVGGATRALSPPAPSLSTAAPSSSSPFAVSINWSRELRRVRTAATVEVDVMPFLARQPATDPSVPGHYGGPFDKYYAALSGLNASFVRFAPWCPNPRLVVPELTPPDCTATKPATNWNSSFFDQLMKDFMHAVCGEAAATGRCDRLSVIQQLSTMPAWMYVGGMKLADLPTNPYVPTTEGHKQYEQGRALVDGTCKTMARHVGRVVGWYTLGGFHDECGHWHHSGLRYSWYGLSILNEDEHGIKPEGGVAYTTCFDAVRHELARINSTVIPVGPEISGHCDYPGKQSEWLAYFMDRRHHTDGFAPPIGSYHMSVSGDNATSEGFYTQWDAALAVFVPAVDSMLKDGQELILNEFVNGVNDWCDCSNVANRSQVCPGNICPDWQNPATAGGDPDLAHGRGVRINRKTWAWNAAAGAFAYAFGTLAEHGYKVVGHDQLVAGTWPDNEPEVAMLDWTTGDPNAKYFVTQLLASTVGADVEKALFGYTAGPGANASVYVLPYRFTEAAGRAKGALVINKRAAPITVALRGPELAGSQATVVEVAPEFPGGAGFQPPQQREVSASGVLELGPFAVAVISA